MKQIVSVVIPTFNESKNIKRLLESVHKQTHKGIEVIVVDDASTDDTSKIAKKLGAKVYERPHSERSVQRNFGAKKAKGSFLLFLDADMELSRKVIEECVACFDTQKIGGVVIPESPVAAKFWEHVKAFERTIYNKDGDPTTDAARFFSIAAYKKAGGYDETITGPEDWDLPENVKKSGYKIARCKSVIFHHESVPSLFSLVKKKYYYGLKAHRYLGKQNLGTVNAKTIYFLRPVFYKNWRTLVKNPVLTTLMIIMLTAELFGGGLGFIIGKATQR